MRLAAVAAVFGLLFRKVGFLIGAILFVLIELSPADAQQRDLEAIYKRYNELFDGGNYPAAFVEVQKFEAGIKARFGVNHVNYGVALNNLALVHQVQGNPPRCA
jgi:hypothetical protein